MDTLITWFTLGILAVLFAAVVVLLTGLPTMILWNYLMPVLFGLKEITFLQAVCLNALCTILFKNSVTTSNGSKK